MNKKESFDIKLKIKDKDGKIMNLNKKVDLEVNWKKGRVEVPKKITFKESGEEFEIIITKLECREGLLKKWTGSFNWNVPPQCFL